MQPTRVNYADEKVNRSPPKLPTYKKNHLSILEVSEGNKYMTRSRPSHQIEMLGRTKTRERDEEGGEL